MQKIQVLNYASYQQEFFGENMNQRRTKIICSLNEKSCNIDTARDMIKAGANAFSLNSSYVKSRQMYENLSKIRDTLEREFDRTIPIIMMLKGKVVRICSLKQQSLNLQAGQQIWLSQDSRIIGDQNIIGVDQEDFFTNLKVGHKIAVDYGNIELDIMEIDTDANAKQYLMDQFPDEYDSIETFRGLNTLNISRDSKTSCSSQESPSKRSEKKSKILDKILSRKAQKATIPLKAVLCRVKENCILKQFKPIFDLNPVQHYNVFDEGEEEESQITCKDIVDFNSAKKHKFDIITLSNVKDSREIEELKTLINNPNIQIYARITTRQGFDNFQNIIKSADGCMIARAYLALQANVEDVVKYQFEMISICRKMLKPVIISTQILESMLTQANPSFTEMGDLASIIEENIDGIMLSGETTYSDSPVKVVEALARVCQKIEGKHNMNKQRILKDFRDCQTPIASVIAQSAIETALNIHAKMILVFTKTFTTTTTLSKLYSPCQIVAVTHIPSIARTLNLVNNVTPILLGSLYGTEHLSERMINLAKEREWVVSGDYVIVMSGNFETPDGRLNQMKLIQI